MCSAGDVFLYGLRRAVYPVRFMIAEFLRVDTYGTLAWLCMGFETEQYGEYG